MTFGRGWWSPALVAVWCSLLASTCLLVAGCDKPPAADKPAGQQATETQTTRMSFDELFDVNGDVVTPKKILRFGSTTMTPDVPFEIKVMRLDNAPFSDYIGRDAEVKREGDLYRIIQFY
jgi:hypothetical protein